MVARERSKIFWVFGLVLSLLLSGCSVKRMAGRAVNDLTTALFQQRDVTLARDGSSSFLLVTDSLILRNPQDPDLLLNGLQVYSAYASAFLLGNDPDRAFTLLDRALDYGFALWKIRFGWESVSLMPIDEWDRALEGMTRNDVPELFWTANTWAAWITVHPDTIVAISDLPYVISAMNRVLALDDTYQNGAAHLFFGMYYAVQPASLGRDLAKSEEHFRKAMELAGPHAMLPKVLFARYFARSSFDVDLFVQTLQNVLDSPSRCPDPNLNLMNAIARERAAEYLKNVDDLF